MIFDTHCHLNSEELFPEIEKYIENAENVGVNRFLVVGWDTQSSLLAIKIAQKYECCYAAIGFHPCNINDVSEEEYNLLMSHLKDNKVVALGEIGLDYYWVKDPIEREKQKKWFIKQIETANEYKKPVIIHNRDSHQDCVEIIKQYRPLSGGVMHCYSGSLEMLKDVLEAGLYVSLGGPVTFTNAKTPKEIASSIPLNKLLIETDSPYLSPHPLRGTINEPKNIKLVLSEIAKLKNIDEKELMDAVFQNSLSCFLI